MRDLLLQALESTASDQVDQKLGLDIGPIEEELLARARALRPSGTMASFGEALHKGHQTWVGLDPQVLNTPYSELLRLVRGLALSPGDLVIDLGAGYGRLGLVLRALHPDVRFRGYELVHERVVEGNRVLRRHGCTTAELVLQDLTADDFFLPPAQFYFLYDYGKVEHIRRTLNQLATLADHSRFTVIARGKGSRSIIDLEHPWLSRTEGPVEDHYSVYTF